MQDQRNTNACQDICVDRYACTRYKDATQARSLELSQHAHSAAHGAVLGNRWKWLLCEDQNVLFLPNFNSFLNTKTLTNFTKNCEEGVDV